MGSKIEFNKHCRLHKIQNIHASASTTQQFSIAKTAGAISLHLTGNEQGSYYFLSLHTGKRVARNNWTVLPMLANGIATIHQFAAECKKYMGIKFTYKDRNIINDDNDTENDIPNNLEVTGVDITENRTTDNRNEYTQVPNITGVPDITGVPTENTSQYACHIAPVQCLRKTKAKLFHHLP